MSREADARKTVIAYCRKLYDKGFVPGIDGNISIRVDADTAVITPSGVSKETVTEEDLVYMKLTGEKISGQRDPSSETPMHLAAYVHRSDVGAVIHAHSPNVIAFAMAGRQIDTRCAPFAYDHLGIVGHVPYYAPGSEALHAGVVSAVKNGYQAIILKSHGPMVLGRNMADAYEKLDLLEAYAEMLMKATLLGGADILTDKQLSEIVHG